MGKIISCEKKIIESKPENGSVYSKNELEIIVSGSFSIFPCGEEFMVLNEKGLYFDLPLNEIASRLYCEKNNVKNLKILGDVLVATKSELGDYKEEE
jgi:hypothetical protein